MSEIEKMYENAGIKTKSGKEITIDPTTDKVNYHNVYYGYPPFTAEKQIELIKWLSRRYIEISNYDAENGRMYNIKPTVGDFATSFNYDFSECIAGLINNLWQDLTAQERTEIAEILRG